MTSVQQFLRIKKGVKAVRIGSNECLTVFSSADSGPLLDTLPHPEMTRFTLTPTGALGRHTGTTRSEKVRERLRRRTLMSSPLLIRKGCVSEYF